MVPMNPDTSPAPKSTRGVRRGDIPDAVSATPMQTRIANAMLSPRVDSTASVAPAAMVPGSRPAVAHRIPGSGVPRSDRRMMSTLSTRLAMPIGPGTKRTSTRARSGAPTSEPPNPNAPCTSAPKAMARAARKNWRGLTPQKPAHITTALGLLAVLLLILVTGFFVAAEFSFVAVDRNRIERLASEGKGAARAVDRILHRLAFYLSGTQLGVTGSSLVLGFIAQPTVATALEPALGDGASLIVGFALVTVVSMVV